MAKVGGKTRRQQVKSIVSKAKQRQNRFSDDGHPLHPTKIAVSGDIFYPYNLNKAANKHKREFPKMVENIRDDRKKDFKKVKPKPSAKRNMYSPNDFGLGPFAAKDGGRAKHKSGGKVKGCGIAKRGLGRAMKKGKR